MKFLLTISLRNLLRQKRRNIFLGSAMAFGVMILIIANSFAHGVSDNMFNKLMVYMTGHVGISINEGSGRNIPIFRDKEWLLNVIDRNTVKSEIKDVDEAVGVFCRGIGNGKADNVVIVGLDMSKTYTPEQLKEFDESFHLIEGSYTDIKRTDIENPIVIPELKAESLNVKMNDIIRVRFRNVYGQSQAGRCKIVGLIGNDNIFMQSVMFVELQNLKKMMGYRDYECGNIQITLNNPVKDAARIANKLHEVLKPGPAFISGIAAAGSSAHVTVLPFMADEESKKIMAESFKLISGKMDDVLAKDGVMMSSKLAASIGARTGSKISISFKPKFEGKGVNFTCKVNGLFSPGPETGDNTIYMHESLFYKNFYAYVPDLKADAGKAFLPQKDAKFFRALGNEWVLLDRTATTDEATKKYKQISKKKIKAATIDVTTMYETASDILKLEGVLNLITLAAVLILFFIIILGVINTLRMTIRERTREIGTIRAIGMQRKDVRAIFLLETVSLTFFAAICGTVLAFIVMWLMSLMTFNVVDNPMGILLINKHLYFVPTAAAIIGYIVLILIIATITAYFPAKRAAKMSAAQALRHYE